MGRRSSIFSSRKKKAFLFRKSCFSLSSEGTYGSKTARVASRRQLRQDRRLLNGWQLVNAQHGTYVAPLKVVHPSLQDIAGRSVGQSNVMLLSLAWQTLPGSLCNANTQGFYRARTPPSSTIICTSEIMKTMGLVRQKIKRVRWLSMVNAYILNIFPRDASVTVVQCVACSVVYMRWWTCSPRSTCRRRQPFGLVH